MTKEARTSRSPLLVTSEHGGNRVPPAYGDLFRGHDALLSSHRGWDPGTLDLAHDLAAGLGAPFVTATVTRLLVDLNRSPHNPRAFSEITRGLPREERRELLDRYHRPHWEAVRTALHATTHGRERALHVAVHSFTPTFNGTTRRTDLALLYDPARRPERELAEAWVRAMRARASDLVIRRNDPYRGASDGLTTALRRERGPASYLGIEIEVSQRHVGRDGRFAPWVAELLINGLGAAVRDG